MTETEATASTTIHTYYEILESGTRFDPGRLQRILAPDLVFEGPIAGHRVGAEPFLKGVAGFVASARHLDLRQLIVTANQAAALYDAELPNGTLRFAEFFELDETVITCLRLVFDPTRYTEFGGR